MALMTEDWMSTRNRVTLNVVGRGRKSMVVNVCKHTHLVRASYIWVNGNPHPKQVKGRMKREIWILVYSKVTSPPRSMVSRMCVSGADKIILDAFDFLHLH